MVHYLEESLIYFPSFFVLMIIINIIICLIYLYIFNRFIIILINSHYLKFLESFSNAAAHLNKDCTCPVYFFMGEQANMNSFSSARAVSCLNPKGFFEEIKRFKPAYKLAIYYFYLHFSADDD